MLEKTQKPKARSKAVPTSLIVRLDFVIDCVGCVAPLPLEQLSEKVRCRACLRMTTIALSRWVAMAKTIVGAAVRERAAPKVMTDFGSTFTARSRVGIEAPFCGGCGSPVDCTSPAPGVAKCACGAAIHVRAADALALALHKKATFIVGERERSLEPQDPVRFACTRCGRALVTDATTRAVACEGCAHADVPDALWDILHPRRRAPMFLVVAGGKS